MAVWQVQQAKARLSEVIEEAYRKGPRILTKHGAEKAAVLSISEYRALTANKPDLRELLLDGPKFDNFQIERDMDVGREVIL